VSISATPGHLSEGAGPFPAPRLAVGMVTAVFVSIGLIDLLDVLLTPGLGAGPIALAVACVVALLLTQLRWYVHRTENPRFPGGYAILATQALLVYLPLFALGHPWLGTAGFLAGNLLLLPRVVPAWTGFGLVVVSTAVLQWAYIPRPAAVLYTTILTLATGLVVYGLSRLVALVTEVRCTRAEVARMAVLRERLRFARDLHDLLGYSLSAITLKIELTHRLMEKAPREAADQLLEVLEISRLALSDTRTVARGYREMSLEEECRSALSVLAAADVAVQVDCDHTDLPVQVSTVLATVLREGVTNLLRHSKAKHCEITIRQSRDRASLEIVNDAAPLPPEERHGGRGLPNLSVRAKEIGGTVTVEHIGNVFQLRADVPVRLARHAFASQPASQPAGVPCDADRVDPVACGQLPDDRREIVPDGAD
jgi:two-component system sensor histidine kinase DesK